MYLLPVYLSFNYVIYCLLHRTQIWRRGSEFNRKMCSWPTHKNESAVLHNATRWRCYALEMGRTAPCVTAALECEVKKCCSRRLQVRVTQNCRTEVLEHRQDQVLSKPRWDMSFREFYVIIRLIPTGVVLLSRWAGGPWADGQMGLAGAAFLGRFTGKKIQVQPPGVLTLQTQMVVRKVGKTMCIYQSSEAGSEVDEPFLTGIQDCRPNNSSF